MLITLYLIAFPIFFFVDMVWLLLVSRSLYQQQIGFLMRMDVKWVPAVIFYALFISGLVLFVITPALEKHSSTDALLHGALFGLISYATYDLTNLATLKHWPLKVSLIDLTWGTALSALVSSLTYLIANKLG